MPTVRALSRSNGSPFAVRQGILHDRSPEVHIAQRKRWSGGVLALPFIPIPR